MMMEIQVLIMMWRMGIVIVKVHQYLVILKEEIMMGMEYVRMLIVMITILFIQRQMGQPVMMVMHRQRMM